MTVQSKERYRRLVFEANLTNAALTKMMTIKLLFKSHVDCWAKIMWRVTAVKSLCKIFVVFHRVISCTKLQYCG